MVLQQEDRLLSQDVAAMPNRHFTAFSIAQFRDGYYQTIDQNRLVLTANSITVQSNNTLHKRHVRGQISAFFNEVSDPFGHADKDIVAAFEGPIIEPVEPDGRAFRGVVDQLFRQADDRGDGQSKHRNCGSKEKRALHDATCRAAKYAACWAME